MFRKMMQLLTLVGIVLLAHSAQAQTGLRIYGALSNFDCYNDTSGDTEGFEIDIDGLQTADVYYLWKYSAFGGPDVADSGTPSAPKVTIRYHSATGRVHPGGVTHFGVTLRKYVASTAVHYRWLPAATIAIPNPAPIPVGLPVHTAAVVITNGVPKVHDIITNTAPPEGKGFWVMPYAHVVRRKVGLDELTSTNVIVQGGVPKGGGKDGTKPELLEPGESWSSEDESGSDDEDSEVYTYKIYEDIVTGDKGNKTHTQGQLVSNMMDASITASGPTVPNELTLDTASVYGTDHVTATVSINGIAPVGGFTVNLTSSDPHVIVPATVVIPEGTISATFTINTTAVANLTSAIVKATDTGNHGSIQGNLSVLPPALTTLWLAFSANFTGTTFDGAVYLIAPAPVGGMKVLLSSSDTNAATVPDSITVPAGETTITFPVQTGLIEASKVVTIQATLGSVVLQQNLTVNPSPRSITGKVELDSCVNYAQPIDFILRPKDGSATITKTLTLGADGSFKLPGVPSKKYDLAIKGRKWLRKVTYLDVTTANAPGMNVTLLAGDINGDNVVGLDDLGMLADAFDTAPGDAFWYEQADLNCDGVVGLDDLGILANNFDTAGDP